MRALVLLKFERIEPLAKWLAERLAQTYARSRELLRHGGARFFAPRSGERPRLQPSRAAFEAIGENPQAAAGGRTASCESGRDRQDLC